MKNGTVQNFLTGSNWDFRFIFKKSWFRFRLCSLWQCKDEDKRILVSLEKKFFFYSVERIGKPNSPSWQFRFSGNKETTMFLMCIRLSPVNLCRGSVPLDKKVFTVDYLTYEQLASFFRNPSRYLTNTRHRHIYHCSTLFVLICICAILLIPIARLTSNVTWQVIVMRTVF
jgi:hypothetical protein